MGLEWVCSPIGVGDDGGWVFGLSGFWLEWVCSPIGVGDDGGWVWSDRVMMMMMMVGFVPRSR